MARYGWCSARRPDTDGQTAAQQPHNRQSRSQADEPQDESGEAGRGQRSAVWHWSLLVAAAEADEVAVGAPDADAAVVDGLVAPPPVTVKGAVKACGPLRKALL